MKSGAITIELQGVEAVLLPEKALFLPGYSVLVIADLHLGKASHFRSAGMSIPLEVGREDLKKIQALVDEWKPKEVLFLGDVFHSSENKEWEWLKEFCAYNTEVQWRLTMGNHDILPQQKYKDLGWDTCNIAQYGALDFCHEPQPELPFCVVGHLHPGYVLRGKGKQRVTLPCFHLTTQLLMMPSFGFFTGHVPQKTRTKDSVFAIADGQIFPISTIQKSG